MDISIPIPIATPIPVPEFCDISSISEAASHAPVAHPVTHENARAVSAVGIGIGVAVAIAIGRHFDIDSDSEPDPDPEIPSEHSIFGTASHAPGAHPVTHENGIGYRFSTPTPISAFAPRIR